MKQSIENLEILSAEKNSAEQELLRSRKLVMIGGALYSGWALIHHLVDPQTLDSVSERLWIFAIMIMLVIFTYVSKSEIANKLKVLQVSRWLLIAHYFTIVERNNISIQYAVCAYCLVFMVASLFKSRLSFLCFSAYVIALSLMCREGQPDFPAYVFQLGIATSLLISFLSLANRMQLIESLSSSELLFRSLFQNTPVGMAIADMKGALAISNATFEKYLGRSSKELQGQKIESWLVESDRQRFSDQFKEFVQGQKSSMTFENKFFNSNNDMVWFRASASKFKTHRDSNFIFLIFENITQQKNAESLVASQQEKLNYNSKMTALGEMAGGVAHEINTPLSVIMLLADSLEMASEKELTPKFVSGISEKIIHTVNRISKIVQGLKKFSRNNQHESKSFSSLVEIAQETVNFCEDSLKNENIKVYLNSNLANPLVKCWQVEISQVLLNLLNNSKDSIRVLPEKWIKIDLSEENEQLIVEFTDSGAPISEEIQNKIFHPFFTTKPVGAGTGLGLSISIGIVHAHGGTLEYDRSSPNCKFVLKIPRNHQPQQTEKEFLVVKAAG